MISISSCQWIGLAWIAFGKVLTISSVGALAHRRPFMTRIVYSVPVRKGQTRQELRSSWLLLTDPAVLLLLIWSGGMRIASWTWTASLGTFAALFVWSDTWMYWSHRAMHHWKWLWRIHAHHHRSRTTQAVSSISFSFAEKLVFYTLGWLLPLAACSHVVPVAFAGIVAFYTFYFVATPIAHGNFEFGSHPVRWPLKVLGTATSHAIHHARVAGNYGFLTSIHDRLYGTLWADSDGVHNRVIAGYPLNNWKERTHA